MRGNHNWFLNSAGNYSCAYCACQVDSSSLVKVVEALPYDLPSKIDPKDVLALLNLEKFYRSNSPYKKDTDCSKNSKHCWIPQDTTGNKFKCEHCKKTLDITGKY